MLFNFKSYNNFVNPFAISALVTASGSFALSII